jgi:hypothetical protein
VNNRGVPCRRCSRPSASGLCRACDERPLPRPPVKPSRAWRTGIRTFVRPLEAMGRAAIWREGARPGRQIEVTYRWEWEDGARADCDAFEAARLARRAA